MIRGILDWLGWRFGPARPQRPSVMVFDEKAGIWRDPDDWRRRGARPKARHENGG